MRFIIFITLQILLTFFAKAGPYVGTGIGISNNSYSANKINIGDGQNLQHISQISHSSFVNINQTQGQFNQAISTAYPTNGSQMYLGTSIDVVKKSFQACLQDGVVVGTPNYQGVCRNGAFGVPNTNQIMQDFGTAALYYLKRKFKDTVSFNFPDKASKQAFELALGQNLFYSILGFKNPTKAQLLEFFQTGSIVGISTIKPNPFQPTGENMQTIVLQTAPNQGEDDKYDTYAELWASMSEGFINTLQNNPNVNFLPVVKSNASSSATEIFLLGGYLAKYRDIFIGGEAMLDFRNKRIGRNLESELEVSSFLTFNFTGKVGYSFWQNSFNYVNAGLAFRKYNVSGFGVDNSEIMPHFVIGTGFEYSVRPQVNIFTELNYVVSTGTLKTGINGADNLAIKSTKLNIGVKYYFGKNPVLAKSTPKPRYSV